jgi:hypothetical protein
VEKRELQSERLVALPMRYETAFIFVRGVNIAQVYQSNTNVQIVDNSFGVFNTAIQGNASSITQH